MGSWSEEICWAIKENENKRALSHRAGCLQGGGALEFRNLYYVYDVSEFYTLSVYQFKTTFPKSMLPAIERHHYFIYCHKSKLLPIKLHVTS